MEIVVRTIVNESTEIVIPNFGKELFMALSPGFIPIKLLGYDGDRVGGLVRIEMGIPPLGGTWVSKIISRSERTDRLEFVDIGVELPFPLVKWKHRHIVRKDGAGRTEIIDAIIYSTHSKFWNFLTYPIMYLMFLMRIPLYKKYFRQIVFRGT